MTESTPQVDVAIGVLVEERDGYTCVLIARRKQDAVLGGYWELPGGKIERGEHPAQCLVREYEEELGITVETTRELPLITFKYDQARSSAAAPKAVPSRATCTWRITAR